MTMFDGWTSPTPLESRKLVDLLFRTNGLYISLEPSTPVAPGDYGSVDKSTGSFLKEGNIFHPSFLPYLDAGIPRSPGFGSRLLGKSDSGVKGGKGQGVQKLSVDEPKKFSAETKVVIHTSHARTWDVGGEAEAAFEPLVSVDFTIHAKFAKERSLVLILAHPYITGLTNKAQLRSVLQLPVLKDKALVGEVYQCPAFALISNQDQEAEAKIAFGAKVPVAAAVGLPVTAGGGPEFAWSISSSTSTSRNGSNGEFFPLMRLYSCGQQPAAIRMRGSEKAGEKTDKEQVEEVLLPSYAPPWKELDEEGNEIQEEEEEYEEVEE